MEADKASEISVRNDDSALSSLYMSWPNTPAKGVGVESRRPCDSIHAATHKGWIAVCEETPYLAAGGWPRGMISTLRTRAGWAPGGVVVA